MPIVPIDTSNGTEFYRHWYEPVTPWPLPSDTFVRLNSRYSFDLDRLRDQVYEVRERHGFQPFPIKKGSNKKRHTYRGIGLTSRPEASDPLYDALHLYGEQGEIDISDAFARQANDVAGDERETVALHERNFSQPTEVFDGYMAEVLSRFRNPLTKTRLLELRPRGVITPHVDFPYYQQIRVHAVISSNDDTWWEVEGRRFRIPADGNFYWFDTGRYHAVWNDGEAERIVLSVNLSLYVDRDGTPRNVGRRIDELLVSEDL